MVYVVSKFLGCFGCHCQSLSILLYFSHSFDTDTTSHIHDLTLFTTTMTTCSRFMLIVFISSFLFDASLSLSTPTNPSHPQPFSNAAVPSQTSSNIHPSVYSYGESCLFGGSTAFVPNATVWMGRKRKRTEKLKSNIFTSNQKATKET